MTSNRKTFRPALDPQAEKLKQQLSVRQTPTNLEKPFFSQESAGLHDYLISHFREYLSAKAKELATQDGSEQVKPRHSLEAYRIYLHELEQITEDISRKQP